MNTPQHALVIRCSSSVGQQILTNALESKFGTCAGFIGRDAVIAEIRSPSTVARVFQATPALHAAIGHGGSVELAIGVRATVETVTPSAVSFSGPAATLWAGLANMPGFRAGSFPELSGPWVSAIERAARGERLA